MDRYSRNIENFLRRVVFKWGAIILVVDLLWTLDQHQEILANARAGVVDMQSDPGGQAQKLAEWAWNEGIPADPVGVRVTRGGTTWDIHLLGARNGDPPITVVDDGVSRPDGIDFL